MALGYISSPIRVQQHRGRCYGHLVSISRQMRRYINKTHIITQETSVDCKRELRLLAKSRSRCQISRGSRGAMLYCLGYTRATASIVIRRFEFAVGRLWSGLQRVKKDSRPQTEREKYVYLMRIGNPCGSCVWTTSSGKCNRRGNGCENHDRSESTERKDVVSSAPGLRSNHFLGPTKTPQHM